MSKKLKDLSKNKILAKVFDKYLDKFDLRHWYITVEIATVFKEDFLPEETYIDYNERYAKILIFKTNKVLMERDLVFNLLRCKLGYSAKESTCPISVFRAELLSLANFIIESKYKISIEKYLK